MAKVPLPLLCYEPERVASLTSPKMERKGRCQARREFFEYSEQLDAATIRQSGIVAAGELNNRACG